MQLLSIPKLQQGTVEVSEWISNFIPQFTGYVITYPCWIKVKGGIGIKLQYLNVDQPWICVYVYSISIYVYECICKNSFLSQYSKFTFSENNDMIVYGIVIYVSNTILWISYLV